MGIFSPRYLWRLEEILTPPTLHSAGHQPQTDRSPDTGVFKGPLQRSVPGDRGGKGWGVLGDTGNSLLASKHDAGLLKQAKEMGFSDKYIAKLWGCTELDVYALRKENGLFPVFRMVDT